MATAGAKHTDRNKIRPLVIKKIIWTSKHQNSGTWKIAYADFVTAMMAFFLLMWLINNNTQVKLRGISEYFRTPLMVAFAGGNEMSDRSTVMKDGSDSPVEGPAQLKKGDVVQTHRFDLTDGRREAIRSEFLRLKELKRKLEIVIEGHEELRQFKDQLLIDITTDGLRIQIIDKQNRPMFDLGSANLKPYTVNILHSIGNVLNGVPNKIGLTGHTDAKPYQGGESGYSNWELSMDRANAARRTLVGGGMEESKITRVVGLSSSALFDPADPFSPQNRRISIIVMNAQAEKNASVDGLVPENE